MDFPGCGDSKAPFTQNTMTNMISDSNACLDYMLKNYPIDKNRLGFLGYSMGGRMAMDITKGSTPYKALGMLAPAVASGEDLINLLVGGAQQAGKYEAEANAKGSVEFTTMYGQVLQLSKEWFADLRKSQPFNNVTFKGPSLIVLGTKDELITKAECDAAENALKRAGSTVTRVSVPEADHGYGFYSDQPNVTKLVESSFADFFAKNL